MQGGPEEQTLIGKHCRRCGMPVAQCGCATGATENAGATDNADADVKEALVGTVLDHRYELIGLLGQGGMGAVYKANNIGIGKMVAVKVLLKAAVTSDTVAKRFSQEAMAAGSLSHANIVGVSDRGITADGMPYMVMDLLDGRGLDALIAEEGHFSVLRAIALFLQVARGLGHAHARGVVHRDLKPSNIVVCHDPQGDELVKIVDFGIAKLMMPTEQALTREGEIFGSPPYMSPEQSTGQAIDQRADVYSLGCVMYEVLTGKQPFRGASSLETLMMQAEKPPIPFREKAPDLVIDADLERIVMNCLEKKPRNRYTTMDEVASALSSVQSRLRQSENSGKRKHIWAFALLAVAILLVGSSLIFNLTKFDHGLFATSGGAGTQSSGNETSIGGGGKTSLFKEEAQKSELAWINVDHAAQADVDGGSYNEAKTLYERAYTIAHTIGPQYELASLEGMSDLAVLTGKDSSIYAARIAEKSKETVDISPLIKALASARDFGTVGELMTQSERVASLLNATGRFKDSRKLLDAALAAGKHYPPSDKRVTARCLLALADTYRSNGNVATSSPELDYRLLALELIKIAPEDHLMQSCLFSIGRYYCAHEPYRSGTDPLKKALELAIRLYGKTSGQAALCLSQLDICYQRQKNPQLAAASGSEALAIFRILKPEQMNGELFHTRGLILDGNGRREEALRDYERSMNEFERGPSKNYPIMAKLLERMAELLDDSNRQKIFFLTRREAILKRLELLSGPEECDLCYRLALCYSTQNNQQKDDQRLHQLVGLVRTLPPHTKNRLIWIRGARLLGIKAGNQRRFEEAEKYGMLFQTWALEEAGPDSLESAEADLLLSTIYLQTERSEEGKKLLDKSYDRLRNYRPKQWEYGEWKGAMDTAEGWIAEIKAGYLAGQKARAKDKHD